MSDDVSKAVDLLKNALSLLENTQPVATVPVALKCGCKRNAKSEETAKWLAENGKCTKHNAAQT